MIDEASGSEEEESEKENAVIDVAEKFDEDSPLCSDGQLTNPYLLEE